jgi:hypothetical protein
VLHEHAASLSAASDANRSRRLTKCAKDSGHYPGDLVFALTVRDSCHAVPSVRGRIDVALNSPD